MLPSSRTPTPLQWARDQALRGQPPQSPTPHFLQVRANSPDASKTATQLPRQLPPLQPLAGQSQSYPSRTECGFEEIFRRPLRDDSQANQLLRSWPAAPPPGRAPHSARPLGGIRRCPRVPTDVPARPAAPVASPHNSWSTFVEWTPPADGDEDPSLHYELKCRCGSVDAGSPSGRDDVVLTDLGRRPWVQLNGLDALQTFFFQVRATNQVGAGPWSFWSEGYTPPKPPQCANGREDVTSSVSPFSAVLQWDEPCNHGSHILGYTLQYGMDPQDEPTLKTIHLANCKTSLEVSDLLPNHLYYFRVQARSAAGLSDWTEWSGGIATKAVPPCVPKAPTLASASARELIVEWELHDTCGFEVVRWDVYISQEDPSMESAIEVSNAAQNRSDRSLQVVDLHPNTAYYFQVRATSAIGESPWSEASQALWTAHAAPEACTDLRISRNEVGLIALEWATPESYLLPIEGFTVRWSDQEHMARELGRKDVLGTVACVVGQLVSSEVRGMRPGARLYFDVRARTSAGEGAWCQPTQEVVACPDMPSQPGPPFVTLTTATTLQVELSDTCDDGGSSILHYELRMARAPEMRDPEKLKGHMRLMPAKGDDDRRKSGGLAPPRMFCYTVTKLEQRGPYYFSVVAVSAVGQSAWSESSRPAWLRTAVPAKMAAPTLAKVDSQSSVLINYVPPADLGYKSDNMVAFELRYAPSLSLLERDQLDDPHVHLVSWEAPASLGRRPPEPVRADHMVSGQTYVIQIRAVSLNGPGLWSEPSEAIEPMPAVPDQPGPIEPYEIHSRAAWLRLKLPKCNGRPVQRCAIQMVGPIWKTSAAKHCSQCEYWREFLDLGVSEVDEELTAVEGADEYEPNVLRLWHRRVDKLESGACYHFSFRCANEVGWSEWSLPSDEIKTTPDKPDKCDAPYMVAKDDGTVSMEWDVPHDYGLAITHYSIEWANNLRFDNSRILEDIAEPRCMLAELKPNTLYYARVAANNRIGRGLFSDMSSKDQYGNVRTLALPPGPVRNVRASLIEDKGDLILTWSNPINDGGLFVSRYKIMYSQEPDMSQAIVIMTKRHRRYLFHKLQPDTTFYFDVAAVNKLADGPFTEEIVVFHTPPLPPSRRLLPVPPKRVDVELASCLRRSITGCQIKVSWMCPEESPVKFGFLFDPDLQTHPIHSYAVRVLTFNEELPELTGDDAVDKMAELALSEQTCEVQQVRDRRSVPKNECNIHIVSDLLPGRWYYVSLRSHNEVGCSPWSLPAGQGGLRAPAGRPAQVPFVRGVGQTSSSLTLEWSFPNDNGEPIQTFLLRWRAAVVQSTMPETPVATPRSRAFVRDAEVFSMDGWECVELAPSGCAVVAGSTVEDDLCRWTIEGLEHATHYTLSVCGGNAIGTGDWLATSPLRTASVEPLAPSAVRGCRGSATQESVGFEWDAPEDDGGEPVDGYEVCWVQLACGGSLPGDLAAIFAGARPAKTPRDVGTHGEQTQLAATQLSHTAKGLYPGSTVFPVVRAWNAIGWSPWSKFPDGIEVEHLSALPEPPAEMVVPPRLERVKSSDHRPYWLNAFWRCPELRGIDVEDFKLRIVPVRKVGRSGASVPAREHVVRHSGADPWVEGQELMLESVHVNLEPGEEYILEVRASSSVGTASGWGVSSPGEFAPPDLPEKPAAPRSPWQWPNMIETDWVKPDCKGSDIRQCAVRYSEAQDMSIKLIELSTEVANQSFVTGQVFISGLHPASPLYYVQVRVENDLGWSEWSDSSEGFSTGACRPDVPVDLTSRNIGTKSVDLCWLVPEDHGRPVTEYELVICPYGESDRLAQAILDANAAGEDEAKQEEGAAALPAKERTLVTAQSLSNPQAPEHSFWDLVGGLTYAVTLRARNAMGWSDWCPMLGPWRTLPSFPEVAPPLQLLQATQNSLRLEYYLPYDNGGPIIKMDMVWTRVDGPADRHLALGRSVTRPHSPVRDGAVDVELPSPPPHRAEPNGIGGHGEVIVGGLEPGAEYEVKIRAESAMGAGPYSPPFRAVCLAGRPDAPTGLAHVNHTTIRASSSGRPKAILFPSMVVENTTK